MTRLFSLLTVVAMAMVLLVPAAAVLAAEMKSEGAWCGGSWDPGAVDSAGKFVQKGGSNFGKCVPMKKTMNGKEMSVSTHPEHPAKMVVIGKDSQGHLAGGTMQSGKFVPIPHRMAPKK